MWRSLIHEYFMVGESMEIIALKTFGAKSNFGDYKVAKYELGEIISGFGFLRIQMKSGAIINVPDEYMGDYITSTALFASHNPDKLEYLDFIEESEMEI